jgi:hypothetical protein
VGRRRGRRTAVAAAASGGETRAPRATAAARGISGTRARATRATATVVKLTATTTKPISGAQLSFRSLGEASCAASSSTGAMNSARAELGRQSEGRRTRRERKQRAAERQEHRVWCTGTARRSGPKVRPRGPCQAVPLVPSYLPGRRSMSLYLRYHMTDAAQSFDLVEATDSLFSRLPSVRYN